MRVSLKGDRKQTGWEVSRADGNALAPVTIGGSVGAVKIPALEFTPAEHGVKDLGA